jgi:hypothetical protein
MFKLYLVCLYEIITQRCNFAIKTCHLSTFLFTCTNHLKTLNHKIIFWGEQIFVTNLALNPPTINATNFAIPWFLYIKSYNRVQKYLWPIFAQFNVFLLNPKFFCIHFDKFWTSFIYILSHILGWTYEFHYILPINQIFRKYSYVSWWMELSHYASIAFIFHNFVQVTFYRECDQFYNTFIYLNQYVWHDILNMD